MVVVPPEISHINGSYILDAGTNLELLCVISGIPHPVVVWTYKGNVISPTQNRRITFSSADSIKVRCNLQTGTWNHVIHNYDT